MSFNPDPKKFAVRFRKGKPVLLERENLEAIKRWRQKRAKLKAEALATLDKRLLRALAGDLNDDQPKAKGRVAKMPNLFSDDDI